jgi:hypothetical protein
MTEIVLRTTGGTSLIYHTDHGCKLIDEDRDYATYRLEVALGWDNLRECHECASDD